MSKPDLAKALAEVNRLRAEHNIGGPLTKMPMGIPDEPEACSLANALVKGRGGAVCDNCWYPNEAVDECYSLSPALYYFRRAFDLGHYPELIERTA